jgi:outer membrane protein
MKKLFALFILFSLAFSTMAGEGVMIRGRIINVAPNDDSSQILDTGTGVTVDDAIVPEVDLTYMFTKNWGLEVIAATSPHDITAEGGALAGADAGEVWVLPPTFTLQYHFGWDEAVDFYAGVGVNYSLFYSYDLSDDLAGLGVTDIDFDDSFGFSGQVGVDFKFKDNWVFNIDLKYIDINTDAELQTAGAPLDTIDVDINPFVSGIGVGYRF